MAIEYEIDSSPPTGLSTQSIWVRLRETTTGEIRLFEAAFVPIEADPETYITANFTAAQMWAAGTTVTDPVEKVRRGAPFLLDDTDYATKTEAELHALIDDLPITPQEKATHKGIATIIVAMRNHIWPEREASAE